jgi:F-type H+-transporting ATPase subunit b
MLLSAAASSTTNTPNFLVPNGTIIIEFILFIVVFGIVGKFILPPLQKVMDERDSTIRGALQASDEGRSEADRLDAETHEVLASARAAARAVLEDAGRQAEEARAAERARGQIEHDRMLLEAEAALELEAASTRRDLAGRLETVVVAAAERVVGIEVDASRHRALLERAVSSLTRTEEASQS